MKILLWNIDKQKKALHYRINRASSVKVISYTTLYGEQITQSVKSIRSSPLYEVRFGRVFSPKKEI